MSKTKNIAKKSSDSESKTVCWMPHQFSEISDDSSQTVTPKAIRAWLMSSQAGCHVKRGQLQENEKGQQTKEIFSPKQSNALKLSSQNTSFLKMSPVCYLENGKWMKSQGNLFHISERFCGGFPKSGMVKSDGLYAVPMTAGRGIAGKGCGYWRSPSANEPGITPGRLRPIEGGELGGMNRHFDKETGRMAQIGLTQQVALRKGCGYWPTPSAMEDRAGIEYIKDTKLKRYKTLTGLNLSSACKITNAGMWPTPSASETKQNQNPRTPGTKGTQPSLSVSVKWPTPSTKDVSGGAVEAIKTAHGWKRVSKQGKSHGAQLHDVAKTMGGQLSPDWTEWLLGWPIGWSSLEPIQELLWLDWSVDPADKGEIPRISTGVPNRVKRLKAIGNGQCPQTFALAWEALL